jgi:hypothetical protein
MHLRVYRITLDVALAPIALYVPINIYSVENTDGSRILQEFQTEKKMSIAKII